MKFLNIFLVLTFVFSCEKADKKAIPLDKKPKKTISNNVQLVKFQQYGEFPPVEYASSFTNDKTQKYGFIIEDMGCEVSSSLVNSVRENNKKSLKLMNEMYGENWAKDFENETKLSLELPGIPK